MIFIIKTGYNLNFHIPYKWLKDINFFKYVWYLKTKSFIRSVGFLLLTGEKKPFSGDILKFPINIYNF